MNDFSLPNPHQALEDSDQPSSEHSTVVTTAYVASISLSVSTLLSTASHLISSKTSTSTSTASSLSPFPSFIKIPSQISSLCNLSTASKPRATRSSASSALSAFPLQAPLRHFPRRPSDPNNPAAIRRCTIVWFRNDLRVHDNEALTSASNESVSILPVYLFDPRDYGKSSSGFDKTGPYRATFMLDSVSDLRKSLKGRGSDLVVRIGRPETVLVEMAKAVGADAVYAHQEVSHDELKTEECIGKAMEEEGVEVKYFWGSTLYHVEDLPMPVEQMPSNYGGFKERVQGLAVRKTIDALDQIKGLPSRGDVEVGKIPTLLDLGLNPPPNVVSFCSCWLVN